MTDAQDSLQARVFDQLIEIIPRVKTAEQLKEVEEIVSDLSAYLNMRALQRAQEALAAAAEAHRRAQIAVEAAKGKVHGG
jgi:hypothetical protein